VFIQVTYSLCSGLHTITAMFIQITVCCGLGVITAMFIQITISVLV
jgi:hypothetical protein